MQLLYLYDIITWFTPIVVVTNKCNNEADSLKAVFAFQFFHWSFRFCNGSFHFITIFFLFENFSKETI